jgi:hypothetical protein
MPAAGLMHSFCIHRSTLLSIERSQTKSTLHWVMPEAKVKHLEQGGLYGVILELADPMPNQRLEKDQGLLGARLYSNAREISLIEPHTDYHVSWLFEEFQIGACPGLMSMRTRAPEVLPPSYTQEY